MGRHFYNYLESEAAEVSVGSFFIKATKRLVNFITIKQIKIDIFSGRVNLYTCTVCLLFRGIFCLGPLHGAL